MFLQFYHQEQLILYHSWKNEEKTYTQIVKYLALWSVNRLIEGLRRGTDISFPTDMSSFLTLNEL